MAKLYGQNASVDFHADKLMSFGKSFSRLSGQPLDKSEVWYNDLQALKDYALTDAAYVGQRVVYINTEKNTVANYCIQIDGSLKEIGTSPIGDQKSIVVAEDGTVSLAGISGLTFTEKNAEGEDVEIKYQPLMTSAGLTWVKPSATTVEGLAAEIEALKADVTALETAVGDAESGLVKSAADNAAGITAINEKIGTVANGKTVVKMIEEAQEAATYDDTELASRVTIAEEQIANVYTKADVYTKTEADTAIATAKTEAIEAIMGEAGIDTKYDTLKEIADWILSDTTNSSQLITRIDNIEKDYLKGADKTELQGAIDDLEEFVGSLPEGAASTTVVAYIQEVVDALKIGDYAKAVDLTELAGRVTTIENKLKDIEEGAQVNKIESVDETQFAIDASKKLTLLDIAQSKVTGLADALASKVAAEEGKRLMTNDEGLKLAAIAEGAQVNFIKSVDTEQFKVDDVGNLTLLAIAQSKVTGLVDALAGKVDKVDGYRMIDADEAAKLEKLVLNTDGTVEVGGTIAAGNIDGLDSWITNHAAELKGLSENNLTDALVTKLNGIAEGAQVNKIEEIKLGDSLLAITNKQVAIPVGAGLKASAEVTIADDGTMGIGTMSVAKLENDANVTLVLNGGNAN